MVSHYDIAPVINILGARQEENLGGVAGDINKIVDAARKRLPRRSVIIVARFRPWAPLLTSSFWPNRRLHHSVYLLEIVMNFILAAIR